VRGRGLLDLPVNIKFTGDRADEHVLPAFDAAESLDGIAKSLLIPVNYLFERKVRRRNFQYRGYSIDLVGVGPGSIDALFLLHLFPGELKVLGDLAVAVGGGAIVEFVKAIYNRTIGKNAPKVIEELESSGELNHGDISALQDAALPSIKRAHTVINKGANNIFIFADQPNAVHFDAESKRYVQGNIINRERRAKLVSVGSYNVNTRYGRVFDYEEGKTIPFDLARKVDAKTITTITGSISDYALAKEGDENLGSAVAILYTSIDTIDGKVKKFLVLKARKEIADLE
jgi:hypothetical protein